MGLAMNAATAAAAFRPLTIPPLSPCRSILLLLLLLLLLPSIDSFEQKPW
jgi:hypothetical protein